MNMLCHIKLYSVHCVAATVKTRNSCVTTFKHMGKRFSQHRGSVPLKVSLQQTLVVPRSNHNSPSFSGCVHTDKGKAISIRSHPHHWQCDDPWQTVLRAVTTAVPHKMNTDRVTFSSHVFCQMYMFYQADSQPLCKQTVCCG